MLTSSLQISIGFVGHRAVVLFSVVMVFAAGGMTTASRADSKASPWYVENVAIPTLRKASSEARPVIVAIVDDAINTSHSGIRPFIYLNAAEGRGSEGLDDDSNGYTDDYTGWDVADRDGDVSAPTDQYRKFSHGTYLAGIVANIASSALGGKAAEWINILPVKALSDDTQNYQLKYAYEGVQYAMDAGADIILAAWNVDHITPEQKRVIEEAEERGVLIVAAAGNERIEKKSYPAVLDSVLAVAATDQADKPLIDSNHGSHVDISAPGQDIESSAYVATRQKISSGTSASAAIVAAAAALVKFTNPSLSHREIAACLINHTDPLNLSKVNRLGKFGSGRLNIERATRCPSLYKAPSKTLVASTGYLSLSMAETGHTWEIDVPCLLYTSPSPRDS